MNQQESLSRINEFFYKFSVQIKQDNAMGLLDKNSIAENILRPLLSIIYGLENLINLNSIKEDFPGLDLGDGEARVAFQISSNVNSKKIRESLASIVKERHYEDYDKFFFYDLTGKQKTYKDTTWGTIIKGNFSCSKENILDSTDLLKKIKHLPLAEMRKVEAILEEHFGELTFTFEDVCNALKAVTQSSIIEAFNSRKTIIRNTFRDQVTKFINSNIRYAFVIGASAVGKSIALATEARQLLEEGKNVLLLRILPDRYFSLEYVTNQIREQLSNPPDKIEWSKIIGNWNNVTPEIEETDSSKLLIIFDGLEIADPEHIALQLSFLHKSLLRTSQSRVKVIISCRDNQFREFLKQKILPLYNITSNLESDSLVDSVRYEIQEFTNSELDAALKEIGATELLIEKNQLGNSNWHVKALRSLLKHPGTFEHYAALFAAGQIKEVQEETWSGLIEKRLEKCIEEIVRFADINDDIRAGLIDFVKLCRAKQVRDFAVNIEDLKTEFPKWFEVRKDNESNVYSNLIKSGVLVEQSGSDSQRMVSFGITDAGAYLLSFVLEEEFSKCLTPSEKAEIVSSWLHEGWSYTPVKDAAIALIDRLSESAEEKRRALLPLLETLISHHHYSEYFQLMKPSVLEFIFKLLKEEKENKGWYGKYFEAAENVRYSVENNELIDRNFTDLHPGARELAVRLVGEYRLSELVSKSLPLLNDENDYVQDAVFKACRKIGVSAIDSIMGALDGTDLPDKLRSQIIWLFISIGYLDSCISECVSKQFKDAFDQKQTHTLRSLLLASAALRDNTQIQFAIKALQSDDLEILIRAGKFFAEIPHEEAFDALKKILTGLDPSNLENLFVFTQTAAALLKINREAARSLIEPILRKSLAAGDNLKPSRVAEFVKKHNLTQCYDAVLEFILQFLKTSQTSVSLVYLNELLEEAWHPDSLEHLTIACNQLINGGNNLARLYVDKILPQNRDEDFGDRLNSVTHLRPLIKGKVSNFATEAVRLLPEAPRFNTRELALYFWVLGDAGVESMLIDKLGHIDRPADNQDSLSFEENSVLRALGTCGTQKSANYIIDLLSENPDGVTINFPKETLLPLLIRNVISPSSLEELIANEKNHSTGRAICIEALARYEPKKHRKLFETIVKNGEDGWLLLTAVIALGVTQSPQSVRPLREILRRKVRDDIKGYAARALSVLGAKEAILDIEEAFSDLESYGQTTVQLFVNALTRFGQQSSIKILRALEKAHVAVTPYFSEALASLSSNTEHKAEIRKKFEQSLEEPISFYESQSFLIKGMLKNPQNDHLELICEHLVNGRLSKNSRQQIRPFLRSLSTNTEVDQGIFVRIIAHLISDSDPVLRYGALSGLSFLNPVLCQKVHESLNAWPASNEWTRSCAVESLGYWDSDESQISNYRFDKEFLVRKAADMAMENQNKRKKLKFHRDTLWKENGINELCSFLCILEHGDMEVARYLNEDISKLEVASLQSIFADYLSRKIFEKADRERSKLESAQKTRLEERAIYFD
ncbi:MAG TPA: SMEK domain-containing protein [Pyrinomonadaceae bacterium]|jgi:HEAT repeat protein|nr:SMEK domain-containing protein [Pyrinomonadaceae bacterium]